MVVDARPFLPGRLGFRLFFLTFICVFSLQAVVDGHSPVAEALALSGGLDNAKRALKLTEEKVILGPLQQVPRQRTCLLGRLSRRMPAGPRCSWTSL